LNFAACISPSWCQCNCCNVQLRTLTWCAPHKLLVIIIKICYPWLLLDC
jgi:hypothetical protein